MSKTSSKTRRKPVTSDPDRGVAVNSGTDPQRPGTTARPVPDTAPPGTSAAETSATTDRFNATHQPATRDADDVEGRGTHSDPDDAL
jgi:hypothetical protein